jgi:hypothetical protein
MKQFGGAASFVGLEVADEVEAGALESGDGGVLGFKFLDVIFAEIAEAERPGVEDDLGREDLCDGDLGDCGARAARAGAGELNSFLDASEIFRQHALLIIECRLRTEYRCAPPSKVS